jgi:hypothetical protein
MKTKFVALVAVSLFCFAGVAMAGNNFGAMARAEVVEGLDLVVAVRAGELQAFERAVATTASDPIGLGLARRYLDGAPSGSRGVIQQYTNPLDLVVALENSVDFTRVPVSTVRDLGLVNSITATPAGWHVTVADSASAHANRFFMGVEVTTYDPWSFPAQNRTSQAWFELGKVSGVPEANVAVCKILMSLNAQLGLYDIRTLLVFGQNYTLVHCSEGYGR